MAKRIISKASSSSSANGVESVSKLGANACRHHHHGRAAAAAAALASQQQQSQNGFMGGGARAFPHSSSESR